MKPWATKQIVCPLHYPELEQCSEHCVARLEFRALSMKLSQLWYERGRGMKACRCRKCRTSTYERA